MCQCVCVHVGIHACSCVYLHVHIYVCMLICVHVCMCSCVFAHECVPMGVEREYGGPHECLPWFFSTLFFEADSVTEAMTHPCARQARNFCPTFPGLGPQLLMWMPGFNSGPPATTASTSLREPPWPCEDFPGTEQQPCDPGPASWMTGFDLVIMKFIILTAM